MIDEIRGLLDDYSAWVRDRNVLRAVSDQWVEITTPFVDRNNDSLQIYARRVPEGFELTDAGETIADLRLSGCELDTDKRRGLLKVITNGFAVQLNDDALEVTASVNNFPLRKHNLVQAMLAVNDLFVLAAPTVASLFHEDVEAWLKGSEVRFTPNVRFVGKSGFDQHFDFAIPASRTHPERLVNAIAVPSRQRISSLLLAWEDTKENRSADARCVAILNDNERPVRHESLMALRNYDITPVKWSERFEALPELAN